MRFLIIILFTLIPFVAISQEDKFNNLESKLLKLESRNAQLNRQMLDLQAENQVLKNYLATAKSEINAQLTKGLELQAQNETAMNLALDQFEKKFREQNETFSFVQNNLDKRLQMQLILLSIFMIVFIIIVFVLTKSVGKKAISQHLANWNTFQEHILKKH